ncbi:MAG: DUF4032 domain-containing protein [Chloroflexi bacterium]|nr:MAG: DUF4032 domain-containing protein [Chloroflexota bacterium]
MVRRTGHPDFLDLPWQLPLEEWTSERLVDVPTGISRHVVRFVEYRDAVYALKELAQRLAEREYRLLAELAGLSIPVVEVAGVVVERSSGDAEELDAVLITRHLDYSLPYSRVLGVSGAGDLRDRLLDALTNLLVRLHVIGFFWGDCSLSNTLFRRDAGALAAYVVDTETSELHPQLSDGQRNQDLLVAQENIAGELMDLTAAGIQHGLDPEETGAELRKRYDSLWCELTREETFGADQRFRIDKRLERLNALGFDVEEIELIAEGDGYRLRLEPRVVEPGHHARRLFALSGLQVQENQARRLLNDLTRFRQDLEQRRGAPVAEALVAHRWLSEVFEPTIAAVPEELRGQLEPAELFHQILDHRWFLSEAAGRDVGLAQATSSFIENVLRSGDPETRRLDPLVTGGQAEPAHD